MRGAPVSGQILWVCSDNGPEGCNHRARGARARSQFPRVAAVTGVSPAGTGGACRSDFREGSRWPHRAPILESRDGHHPDAPAQEVHQDLGHSDPSKRFLNSVRSF